MTEPTPDELARWAEEHRPVSWGLCGYCEDEEWPCSVTRLLALVGAQAEQIADGERERRAAGVRFEKSLTEQDAKLEQALKVLREARTEVDRLTHAVSEKYYRGAEMIDAAHERARTAEAKLARVRALCDKWDGTIGVPLGQLRAALDGTEGDA